MEKGEDAVLTDCGAGLMRPVVLCPAAFYSLLRHHMLSWRRGISPVLLLHPDC